MKTIPIEDDVYKMLKDVGELGESASNILRRVLGSTKAIASKRVHRGENKTASQEAKRQSDIYDALQDRRFRFRRTAVDRFLFLLAWIQSKRPEQFSGVLELGGRSRRYFAHSAADLAESGTNVNPQRIQDSDFWVVTNNDTIKKEQILQDVMRITGYGPAEAAAIRGQLAANNHDLAATF